MTLEQQVKLKKEIMEVLRYSSEDDRSMEKQVGNLIGEYNMFGDAEIRRRLRCMVERYEAIIDPRTNMARIDREGGTLLAIVDDARQLIAALTT